MHSFGGRARPEHRCLRTAGPGPAAAPEAAGCLRRLDRPLPRRSRRRAQYRRRDASRALGHGSARRPAPVPRPGCRGRRQCQGTTEPYDVGCDRAHAHQCGHRAQAADELTRDVPGRSQHRHRAATALTSPVSACRVRSTTTHNHADQADTCCVTTSLVYRGNDRSCYRCEIDCGDGFVGAGLPNQRERFLSRSC